MKALLIDNERHIIDGLVHLIERHCPQITSLDTASDIKSGIAKIESFQPDLLFLDIELGEGTGFDLLNALVEYNFQVIFITAFDQYALEAFKFSAIDYLLKPIDSDDLQQSVQRASTLIDQEKDQMRLQVLLGNLQSVPGKDKKIIVRDRENIYAVDIQSILYLEADGPYTKIKRTNDYIFTSKNLKHFEVMLANSGFCRTHHSYLANLSHMRRFDKTESLLELNNGDRIPVSVRKKDSFLAALQQYFNT